MSAPGEESLATDVSVYRDDQGVPHIVAESEKSAWYALGFEQARDGLLWIQYACKAAKGELTWVRGDEAGVANDLAVKLFGAHLGGRSPGQLDTLFRKVNPAIQGNFYDNCVAFANGVNAYRAVVANATPGVGPEGQLRAWLANPANRFVFGQPDLTWVYAHSVDPVDILSQGAWTSAFWSFFRAELAVVNSSGTSYALGGGSGEPAVDPELVVDPLAPGTVTRLFEDMRKHVAAMPGTPSAMSGSNSFAWSRLYCQDPATSTSYAGLLADPHHALPFYGPSFMSQFKSAPNHMWFAHVKVTPPGASQPTLDVFGHVPHAAASFVSSHNRTVAMGGTAGAPNHTDHFVLRLEEDPTTGGPLGAYPHRYYSYYHDPSNSNTTYQPITQHSVAIKRPDNNSVPVPYWRAQSFGIILPNLTQAVLFVGGGTAPTMPIVYGEKVLAQPNTPAPRWRVNGRANPPPPKMRYWRTAQRDPVTTILLTTPMVVTLRAPMDAAVAGNQLDNPQAPGENRHWLLLRDFWEISHATSVYDAIPRTNGAAYNVNVCFVDNQGRTASTQLSAIPKRGNDSDLHQAQYTSYDKYLFYSDAVGPVPARSYDDRKFDWRFGTAGTTTRPAPLEYLDYPPGSPLAPALAANNTQGFKPLTMQNQLLNVAFPPPNPSGSGASFKIESGFFTSATNDQIWGYSRKRDALAWLTPIPAPHTGGIANDLSTPDNWLLKMALQAGCVYQSGGLSFEGPDRHQIIVDRFTQQAERIVQGGGLPALTPAQMREFVVSPRLYSEPTYVTPGAVADATLPVAIRQLKEVISNQTFRYTPPPQPPPLPWPWEAPFVSPLLRAQEELAFFKDFWTELNRAQSPWNVYAPNPAQPGVQVSLRTLWVNANDVNHPNQVFWYHSTTSPVVLRWIDLPADFPLVDFLWTDSDLGRGLTTGAAAAGSTPDALPEMNRLTTLVNNLVQWQPLLPAADRYRNEPSSPGACLLEMMRMGYNARGTFSRKWRLLQRGVSSPSLREAPWEKLQGLAFPDSQMASLFRGGLTPPYEALYSNVQARTLRTTLRPEDINALVKFFLELGGHYINPADNGGNPSRKLARWELASIGAASNAVAQDNFMTFLPGNYPLTGGLERVTVLRRLLDTDVFLNFASPPMSQHFKARAYDHNNQQLWPDPAVATDTDCVGGGLRSVGWYEDSSVTGPLPWLVERGFQPKFLGMSGSYATLLALFPKLATAPGPGEVESYFWCTPGVQAMGPDLRVPPQTSRRFDLHMDAYRRNVLMRSHYSDFLTNHVTMVVHTCAF